MVYFIISLRLMPPRLYGICYLILPDAFEAIWLVLFYFSLDACMAIWLILFYLLPNACEAIWLVVYFCVTP